jgi:hypothetical protein
MIETHTMIVEFNIRFDQFERFFLSGATPAILSSTEEKENFDGIRVNVGHHPLAVYELEYYVSFDD